MQFSASFGTSFLYYSIKWGGLSPDPKRGSYPLSPCSDAYDSVFSDFIIPYLSLGVLGTSYVVAYGCFLHVRCVDLVVST